jgi:hypothetical protein
MARYDKYDPVSGGFRAPLELAIASVDVGKLYAVGLNSSGRVIRAGLGAITDITGLICAVRPMAAREIVDVMTAGEIVEALETAATAFSANGSLVYGHADGTVDDTATAGKVVARIVELPATGARLVVRVPL